MWNIATIAVYLHTVRVVFFPKVLPFGENLAHFRAKSSNVSIHFRTMYIHILNKRPITLLIGAKTASNSLISLKLRSFTGLLGHVIVPTEKVILSYSLQSLLVTYLLT